MTDEELNEIESRADPMDVPRLAAEIRRFRAIIEAAWQIEDARLRSDAAYDLYLQVAAEVRQAEERLRSALATL